MPQIDLSLLKSKFPRISRFIPEIPREEQFFYAKIFVVSFVSLFLLVAISHKGFSLLTTINQLEAAGQRRSQLEQERVYWDQVVKEHPGYRDANFQLSVISYQLGDLANARHYLQQALHIDPNFQEGKEFGEKIGL